MFRNAAVIILFGIVGFIAGCKSEKKSTCDYDRFINDTQTPEQARLMAKGDSWKLNELAALGFLDSMTAARKEMRPFYFRVVTNSLQQADGAYAEALGLAGKDYVEYNTHEFAAHFDNNACFSEKDIDAWVDIVMLEFGLLIENESDSGSMNEYLQAVRNNCGECTVSQKATIEKFLSKLEKSWQDLIKYLKEEAIKNE